MIGILGKKIGMTQIFDKEGKLIPVTVIEAGPCHITQIRTQDKHGYTAVQLGFDKVKDKKLTKPVLGQLKKSNAPALKFMREIRTESVDGLKIGQQVTADIFEAGELVDVESISIGRGFQSAVKRHHFKGGEVCHGSMHGRQPGSIGASAFPSRVVKGMRMAGHMGDHRTTVQNLKVVKVDAGNNLLAIRGSVPGFEGKYLVVRTALKKGNHSKKWKVQGSSDNASKTAVKDAASEETQTKS